MPTLICPRCKSVNVHLVNYRGISMRICDDCGYDETMEYESEGGEKSSQKAKGSYSPYKSGGSSRTRK